MTEQQWRAQAARYDVRFDGIQKFREGNPLPMFTHRFYGTFVVTEEDKTLARAILRKKEQYESVDKMLEAK
ncbi:MAG: hypothetical protein HYV29_01655 [Ignavibacteriales bacterium]|nr:hypothetical protein [Ignavibacteriales bacterium]